VGGTEGIGVRFLEETFTARAAVPEHRAVANPARMLLQALLPEAGTDIKGQMRTRGELADACAIAKDSPRFARLLEILDHDVHIITPTEPADAEPLGTHSNTDPCYQLTHDYLVPPLRQWLPMERRKTWRGRAEICLEERTAQMSHWPQSHYLPSLIEFIWISLAVPRARRTSVQRLLMSLSAKHHGLRSGIVLLAVILGTLVSYQFLARLKSERIRNELATHVDALLSDSPETVPYRVGKLERNPDMARMLLRTEWDQSAPGSTSQLHIALALVALGEPITPSLSQCLVDAIRSAPGAECRNIVNALRIVGQPAVPQLLQCVNEDQQSVPWSVRSRYATVLLHIGNYDAIRDLLGLSPDPTGRTTFIHGFERWHGDLSELPQLMRELADGDARSGLCAALGSIPPEEIPPEARSRLEGIMREFYLHAPDGGTHAAARWVLNRWKIELPDLPASYQPVGEKKWFQNHQGITFVEIPAAETTDSRHFVSSSEITHGVFRAFMSDPEYDGKLKPGWVDNRNANDNTPVSRITWYDALLFMNWLNWKNGLVPCYATTGKKEKLKAPSGEEREVDEWAWDRTRKGYRLLTDAEWRFDASAGAATNYLFGNDDSLLGNYAVYLAKAPAPVATKLPNAWGLFDVHGNIYEWCWDLYDTSRPGGSRAARGGAYPNAAEHCGLGIRFRLSPLEDSDTSGFRVAFECD
jgi:formylglycine-generating enzyme required for sulfatase activity